MSDEVRDALRARLTRAKETKDRAEEDFYIDVYLMFQAGLTFDEITRELGASVGAVNDWKKKGEEASRRRESARGHRPDQDPVRSGERESVS
ncbi:hypothetical protein OG381_34555 [Streptomyces sp. NBC_00490]|uniref:hypothetical protein n=1 Tax=Streptomyces sp. NBC_00490 TaxID=2903657 RepID=UPI002E18A1F9